MKKAEIGNIVEWEHQLRNGETIKLKGKVCNVHDNIAVVDQRVNDNWKALGLEERSGVKHTLYKVVDDSTEYKEENLISYKVVPGSKENYEMLRSMGKKDKEIREIWYMHDKEVKWHANRFQQWKVDNGYAKSRKQSVNEVVEGPKIDQLAKAYDEALNDERNVTSLTLNVEQEDAEQLKEELKKAPAVIVPLETPTVTLLSNEALKAEIDALRAELEVTRMELWSERTSRLFTMQAQLDAIICESNSLQIADFETEHLLATVVELAEVAQEEQSFKYWKKNKNVDRSKLLEELVDVLHFILSRGVQHGVRQVAITDLPPRETVSDQMLLIIELLMDFRKGLPNKNNLVQALFQAFYGLTVLLECGWSDIVTAYEKKHTENIARQNRNY